MDTSMIEATQALEFDDDCEDINEEDHDGNRIVGYLNVPCQKGFPGKQYPVTEGDNIIGRGDHCAIYIPLKGLSREHACIEVKGENHFIYDKGSRNKTKRNNFFLSTQVRYELKDGDKLLFGDVNCSYKIGEQTEDNDDTGSETGSESMFETAPSASMNGLTVLETPAQPKSASRLLDNLTIPESDSEPDDDVTKTVTTLEADTQDTSAVNLMGAPTQAFVSDSDVTTDDDSPKKSILTAATQAYSMDTASSDEESPSKRSLLSAATQAFVADSDESPQPKKARKNLGQIDPTLKYDMPEVIAATQGYDMEGDTDGENEEEEEESRKQLLCQATQAFKQDGEGEESDIETDDEKDNTDRGQLMAQPTQAFFPDKQKNKDKDNEEVESDTSEDFVLEGDTDNEDDSETARNIFAAPTLACDDVMDNRETSNDQTVEVEDRTLAVWNEATQAVVDKVNEPDATVAVEDDATQVIEDKTKEQEATVAEEDTTQAIIDMETQIVSDTSPSKKRYPEIDATQVFAEKSPQKKIVYGDDRVTQVFDNDATQVLQETNNVDTSADTLTPSSSSEKMVGQSEMATQVFEDAATQGVGKEDPMNSSKTTERQDSGSFDITAASTFAPTDSVEFSPQTEAKEMDATQVFDNVESKTNNQNLADLETQVFDEATAKVTEVDQTMVVSDDTVEPISETVQVSNIKEDWIDATVTDDMKQTVQNPDTAPISDAVHISDPVVMETVQVSDTVPVNDTFAMQTAQVSDTVPVKDTVAIETALLSDTVPVNDTVAMETVHVSDAVPVNDAIAMETLPVVSVIDTDKADTKDDNKMTRAKRGKGKKKEQIEEVTANQSVKQIEATDPTETEQPVSATNRSSRRGKSSLKSHETVTGNNKNQRKSGRNQKSENMTIVKDSGDSENNLVLKENSTDTIDKTKRDTNKLQELELKKTARPSRSRTKKKEKELVEDTGQDKVTTETDETGDKAQSDTRRGRRSKRTVEPVVKSIEAEPATQAYFEEPATQLYKDSPKKGYRDEEPTQRFGDDDSTQSLSQIEDEESNPLVIPKTAVVSIPSRSPLKSAMASPEKKKSPSPKRVQFISQNSDNTSSTSDKQVKENTVDDTGSEKKSDLVKTVENKVEMRPTRKRKSMVKDKLQNDNNGPPSEIQPKSKDGESDDKNSEENEQSASDISKAPRRTARGRTKDTEKGDDKSQSKEKLEDANKANELIAGENDQNGEASKTESKTRRKTRTEPLDKKQEIGEKKPTSRSKRTSQPPKANEKRNVSETVIDALKEDQTHSEIVSESGDTACEKSELGENDSDVLKSTTSTSGTSNETKNNLHVKERSQRKRKSAAQETSEINSKSEQIDEISQNESILGVKTKKEKLETITETSEKTRPSRSRRATKSLVGGDPQNSENKKETESNTALEKQPKSDTIVDGKLNSELNKDNSGDKEVKSESRSRRTKRGTNKEPDIENITSAQDSDQTEHGRGKRKSVKVDDNISDISESKETESNQRKGRKAKNVEDDELETERSGKSNIEKDDKAKTFKGKKALSSAGDKSSEDSDIVEAKKDTRTKRTAGVSETGEPGSQTISGDKFTKNSEASENKHVTRKVKRSSVVSQPDKPVSETSCETDTRKSRRTKEVVNNNIRTEQSEKLGSQESDKNETTKGKRKTRVKIDMENMESKEGYSDKIGKKDKANVKVGVKTETNELDTSKKKEDTVKKNEEETKAKTVTGRRAGKRKGTDESSSDSTDQSQNDEGTPAKKQRVKDVSTPKNLSKQIASLETPKSKPLDTSVTESPTLRKTTTSSEKPKVMFTGVTDEQGEKIVKELGGELVSSVTECTHLVTDQIRRTVKFLCCLARGIPIISPQWLISSKKCGFFSDTTAHLIRDDASEKKFKCSLQRSLSKAGERPMLEGYKIHVTKSVKPGPDQMKDILKCAGAQYLTSMPKSSSPTTLVISCEDDKSQCDSAVKHGITVVTAEFVLTGILRQEVDLHSYMLFSEPEDKKGSSQEPVSKKRKR